jgi:hypothetical protein
MMERTGGCACRAIRFRITGPFLAVGVCHCTDCQKASGGGPNYFAVAPSDAFEVTRGEAKVYVGKGDSGADVRRAFCQECGSPYGPCRRMRRSGPSSWARWMTIRT